ncbi:MAG: restriction endonuclease subunit S [Coriobacteriales bacterium]|jgi:type I restriction enzyme S subunit|nr:restriction endonuclease subunit S [Coriobacteriales bacterium]
MSTLQRLIAELCPDGVEYKTLGEVCLPTMTINWKQTREHFFYIDLSSVDIGTGMISEMQVIDSTTAPDRAQKIVITDDVIFGTTRPMLRRFCSIPPEYNDQICSTGFCVLRANQVFVLPRYVFHTISSADFFVYVEANQRGSAYPAISDRVVRDYHLPIPPLPVQQEIVRILDKFTALEAELESKLEVELEARKKQYEFYRDYLLTFDAEDNELFREKHNSKPQISYHWMNLGDVSKMAAGTSINRQSISEIQDDEYLYPCFGGNGIRGYTREFNREGDSILIGRQGALCGNVKRATGRFYATEHAVVVDTKEHVDWKWLFHMLEHMNLNQHATKSAQPGLAVSNIEKLTIPIPPLEEQERIVAILDRFDALVNDLTSGLPAEIAARRKQYEYYRDKLLTFRELKVFSP